MSGSRGILLRGPLKGYEFSQQALNTLIPPRGSVKLRFNGEHQDEYLEAQALNGYLEGEAYIKNDRKEVFKLNMKKNEISGKYVEYYDNGKKKREGYLEKSIRTGEGSEYDESGFVLYKGVYEYDKPSDSEFISKSGDIEYKCNYDKNRGTVIRERSDHVGYELEVSVDGKPLRYYYVDGGNEVLLRLYAGNVMFDYENGDLLFWGAYENDPWRGFPPKCKPDHLYGINIQCEQNQKKVHEKSLLVGNIPKESSVLFVDSMEDVDKSMLPVEVDDDIEDSNRASITPSMGYAEKVTSEIKEIRKEAEEKLRIAEKVLKDVKAGKKEWKTKNGDYCICYEITKENMTGTFVVSRNKKCVMIGRVEKGKRNGAVFEFDGEQLREKTEYENGKKKKRWVFKNDRFAKKIEYLEDGSEKWFDMKADKEESEVEFEGTVKEGVYDGTACVEEKEMGLTGKIQKNKLDGSLWWYYKYGEKNLFMEKTKDYYLFYDRGSKDNMERSSYKWIGKLLSTAVQ